MVYISIMKVSVNRLKNKYQTGNEIHRMVDMYSNDLNNIRVLYHGRMCPFMNLSIDQVFDFVRMIPYRKDFKPIEVVARPLEILRNKKLGMDCKKKTILIASYFKNRNIPYRLMTSSKLRSRRIHHIFPQMFFLGEWLNFDATYNHYHPFETKFITASEVL